MYWSIAGGAGVGSMTVSPMHNETQHLDPGKRARPQLHGCAAELERFQPLLGQ